MKKVDVEIDGQYIAKVSGELATVKIIGESVHGGWVATNVKTGRRIRIRSAQRLRAPAGGKYVITCTGASEKRYLAKGPSWALDRGEAFVFSDYGKADAYRRINGWQMHDDVKIEEVA
jgi:hypothetical protein